MSREPTSNATSRERLDIALVTRKLAPTRSRAREMIKEGHVLVAGKPAGKPAMTVSPGEEITLSQGALSYVSRAALKLSHALDHFGINPNGAIALDLGASTGGFTEILLERGAAHVFAVDVGHDQLHESLRAHPRVTSLEGRDARSLTAADFIIGEDATTSDANPEPLQPNLLTMPNFLTRPNFLTMDVSFISFQKALAHPLTLLAPGSRLIGLIKPQFEVGQKGLNKKGVVRDEALSKEAVIEVTNWLNAQPGWQVLGLTPSPIKGHAGNRETLIAAQNLPK